MVLSPFLHVSQLKQFAPEISLEIWVCQMRIGNGGGADAWIMWTLAVPGMQVSCRPSARDMVLLGFFSNLWHLCPSEDQECRQGGSLDHLDLGITQCSWKPVAMCALRFFTSLWHPCPSEDQAWRWHGCLELRDLSSTKYTGKPAAMGIEDMVLLELFSSLCQLVFRRAPSLALLYCILCP